MNNTKFVPKDVQEVITESQSEVLARLKLTGVSNVDAAKQLGITEYRVRKLQEQDEFKKHLREASETMVSVAANTWKGMMEDLIPLAYQTLKAALKKGDLRGVEVVIKTLGIDKQVQNNTNSGNLQIVLPNFTDNKTAKPDIEVS